MRKLFLFILVIFTSNQHLLSQTPLLDSLKRSVEASKSDSERLIKRMYYAIYFAKVDLAKGIAEMNSIRQEGLKMKSPSIYAKATRMMGAIYYDSGDYINMIATSDEAEKLYLVLPESGFKTIGLANIYNDVGACYSLINDMENAQRYYTRSIALWEKIKDSSHLMMTNFNLAFIYIDMQEWQNALVYFKKAMLFEQSAEDINMVIQLYARTAVMYFRLNDISKGKKILDSCKRILSKDTPDLEWNYYYNASGEYYYSIHRPAEALQEFSQAYRHGLKWKDPYFLADDAWELGRTFLLMNQTDSAEVYLQKALNIAKEYKYLPKTRFILNEWCNYYDHTGNYKKAYTLRTDLLHFTDSLVNLQNHNRILLFDAKYNSQEKETQILQLTNERRIQSLVIRQTNILNYFLAAGAAILLVISFLAYRNYRQKQKLQQQRIIELETEKQLTATQAVLKGEEQERTRLAKDLHDGLGGMLSGIKYSFKTMKGNMVMTPENAQVFERSMDMLDSSIIEMRRVAHNMMPETLVKFGLDVAINDFCNDITQSGALKVSYQVLGFEDAVLDQTTAITIYRIVQELINNTIKHAGAEFAIVQLVKTEHQIAITVEDNGKGFDAGILKSGEGIGWSNIQSRVEFLKGQLNVQSRAGNGTSVHIELPL